MSMKIGCLLSMLLIAASIGPNVFASPVTNFPEESRTALSESLEAILSFDTEKQATMVNINDLQKEKNTAYPIKHQPMDEMDLDVGNFSGVNSLQVDDLSETNSSSRIGRQAPTPTPFLGDYFFFANRPFLIKLQTLPSRYVFTFRDLNNSIAVDCSKRLDYLFWSDSVPTARIHAVRPDGTGLVTLVNTNIITPDGIAYDWINHMLYWTDADDHDIEVLDVFQVVNRKLLFRTGKTSMPRAIVVDPITRWMYWTDWGQPAKIERASMDGTCRSVLHTQNLVWPNGLTIDYTTQVLYWVDASLDRLETSNTDGTGRRLLSVTHIYHPFGITFFRNNLIWSDWQLNSLLYAPLNNIGDVRYFSMMQNLTFDPMGIATCSLEREPLGVNANKCLLSQCTHLCLLSSCDPRGYTCACPEGMYLSADRRNCNAGVLTSTVMIEDAICVPECQNDGICISTGECSCQAGWRGPQCEEAICSPPCRNNGICTEPGHCSCTPGWDGLMCEHAVCAEDYCMNGGTCINPNSPCRCLDGWAGRHCEIPVCKNNCVQGECIGPNTCNCSDGWDGAVCDEPVCENGFCKNGGTCLIPNVICHCPDKWIGNTCEHAVCSSLCLHGRCTAPDTCTCDNGWMGTSCDTPICNPSCVNGNCVVPDVCSCNSGWDGVICNSAICDPSCANGNCIRPDVCSCNDGWEGAICDRVSCFPPEGCLNGGECVSHSLCACPLNWRGRACDIAVCSVCVHGDCIAPEKCHCDQGWEGEHCDRAICFPPDGCLNEGECLQPGICSCSSRWKGGRCEKPICSPSCLHGDCIDRNGKHVCNCNQGWYGQQCERATCLPGCVNGHCIIPNICACDHGYEGSRCENSLLND